MKQLIEEGIYEIAKRDRTCYQVIVSIRINGRRLYRQETFTNLTQARLARKRLFAEVVERSKESPVMTLSEFVDRFLAEDAPKRWSPSTLYRRKSLLDCHYRKEFGDISLDKITTAMLIEHYDRVTNGKANSSKRELHKTIKAVFERAVELELVQKNPVLAVTRPPKKSKEPKVLSESQVKLLLQELKRNHQLLYYHVALAVLTLARAGELRALTWGDIDFAGRYITISKTLDPRTGLKNSTKNEQIRKIWINDELMMVLRELETATFTNSTDPVLPHWREFAQNEQGKPLKVFCRQLGLPEIRFHDLRATGITLLLNNGKPLPLVMKLAGHKRITTTEIYTRLAGVEIKGSTDGISLLKNITEQLENIL